MRSPDFWRHDGAVPTILGPLSLLYDTAAHVRRSLARPYRAAVPVVCIGNLVAGGAGKTPVALAVLARLAEIGLAPHALTRGHGGRIAGPHRVDPAHDDAGTVGDEPLLLADAAPTWVSVDRPAGARAAVQAGAKTVVMDDGFQNPSLVKDLSVVVVDGGYGFGNGRVIPAGPLRETVAAGAARADAAVILGDDISGAEDALGGALPVYHGRLVPLPGSDRLSGRRVVAFAGIGRPMKFFVTLRELGCEVVSAHAFPDHHRYGEIEIMSLVEDAAARDATLVTTAKDWVRLTATMRRMTEVIEVAVEWREADALDRLLAPVLGARSGAAHA